MKTVPISAIWIQDAGQMGYKFSFSRTWNSWLAWGELGALDFVCYFLFSVRPQFSSFCSSLPRIPLPILSLILQNQCFTVLSLWASHTVMSCPADIITDIFQYFHTYCRLSLSEDILDQSQPFLLLFPLPQPFFKVLPLPSPHLSAKLKIALPKIGIYFCTYKFTQRIWSL